MIKEAKVLSSNETRSEKWHWYYKYKGDCLGELPSKDACLNQAARQHKGAWFETFSHFP